MDYPELDKRTRLLRALDRQLKAARERGQRTLWLGFYNQRHGREARLEVQDDRTSVAEEAQLSGAEAIGLLEELGASGYVRLELDRYGFDADAGMVGVTFLDRGRTAIEQLPDPHQKLLQALDAITEAIEELEDVDPEEREEALEGAKRIRGFLADLPAGITVEVLSRIATVLGAPGG